MIGVTAVGSRRALLIAVTLVLLLGMGSARSANAAGAPAGIGALRICSNCAGTGGNLSRYKYVILNSWDAPLLPALKAANPGLKALVYKNLSFTVSYGCSNGVDNPYQSTGVGYCDAGKNHPDWFLTDGSGARLNSNYFPQAWVMDVGNPGYQAQWLSNVWSDVRSGGWDGVFMDDTNTDMSWHLGSKTVAKYPTASAWREATRSMLATVGPALISSGFLAIPNIAAPWSPNYDAQATWSDWIQFTSGATQEHYSKWGSDSSGWLAGNDWTYQQRFQTLTENAGKIFLGLTYGPRADVRTMTWARANFLLFDEPANGGALVYEFSDPEAQDPYAPEWTSDVGTPLGQRFQVGSAWRRNFTGGIVLVNPTTSLVTVALEQQYLRDDGSSTTSVTLGPTSGAILRSSSGSVPPPPPAAQAPPPAPVATPTLSGSVSGMKVSLHWTGLSGSRVDIFRNGGRKATVANSGSYGDNLKRKPKGTYSYKVCQAGTSTCTETIVVTVGAAPSVAGTQSAKRVFHVARVARPQRGHQRRHVIRR